MAKNLVKNTGEFNFSIREDMAAVARIFEKWQYAEYAPEGIDAIIDKLIDIRFDMSELLK